MIWNDHSKFEGSHAFLGASKYSWINYDDEHLISAYNNYTASQRGTILHAFAADCIKLGRKLKGSDTLSSYVNDAIGFGMDPEVILYYSQYCYGTADSISFRKEKGKETLRIHDLKTGIMPAHMEQLEVYAALFCLEYKKKPQDINIELRLYQNDDILIGNPTIEDIAPIMDKAIHYTKIISELEKEV